MSWTAWCAPADCLTCAGEDFPHLREASDGGGRQARRCTRCTASRDQPNCEPARRRWIPPIGCIDHHGCSPQAIKNQKHNRPLDVLAPVTAQAIKKGRKAKFGGIESPYVVNCNYTCIMAYRRSKDVWHGPSRCAQRWGALLAGEQAMPARSSGMKEAHGQGAARGCDGLDLQGVGVAGESRSSGEGRSPVLVVAARIRSRM